MGITRRMSRRVGTEEGLDERRSAGLSRVGRGFARRTDVLEDWNGRLRFRLIDENRIYSRQEKNGESRHVGRFPRSRECQRVVRCPVRLVMVGVRIMVAIVMSIVVKGGVSDRSQRVVEMSLGRKMDGDEADVEREQQRDEQTAPPAHPVGRAMEALRSASVHHQFRKNSFPAGSPSTIEFVEFVCSYENRWGTSARTVLWRIQRPRRQRPAMRNSL